MYHIGFRVVHLLCEIWFLWQKQELTSAVLDAEVIGHFFIHVIASYVLKHQKPALHVKFANLSSPTTQLPSKGKEDFVNRLKCKLEFVVKEAPKEQVWNKFYGGDISSEIFSSFV